MNRRSIFKTIGAGIVALLLPAKANSKEISQDIKQNRINNLHEMEFILIGYHKDDADKFNYPYIKDLIYGRSKIKLKIPTPQQDPQIINMSENYNWLAMELESMARSMARHITSKFINQRKIL